MTADQQHIQLFEVGDQVFVRIPYGQGESCLRGLPGAHYDRGTRAWAVDKTHLEQLVRNMLEDPFGQKLLPPEIHPASFISSVDEVVSKWKLAKDLRTGKANLIVPPHLTYNGVAPRRYQYEAALFMQQTQKSILSLRLGAGKTFSVITTLKLIKEQKQGFNSAVIICPATTKRLVWQFQIHQYSAFDPLVIEGTPAQRKKLYNTAADIYILNPALALVDSYEVRKLVQRSSILILDEANVVQNDTSQISKLVRELAADVPWFIMMTGTPLMNSVMELYTLTSMISQSIFRDKRSFKYRFIPRAKDGSWLMHEVQNSTELAMKVSPFIFSRADIDDEMPKTVPMTIEVEMTVGQQKLYEEIRDEARITLSAYERAEGKATKAGIIRSVIAQIVRMKQVCDDPLLLGLDVNSAKTKRLFRLMDEDLCKTKTLIFTQFADMANHLRHGFSWEFSYHEELSTVQILTGSSKPKEREAAVNAFNQDPNCRILVMTTAGGVGLNLPACGAVVLYDILWNPKMMDQIVGRAVRMDSIHQSIPVVTMICRDSVEEKIIHRNQRKSATYDKVFGGDGSSWLAGELGDEATTYEFLKEILA